MEDERELSPNEASAALTSFVKTWNRPAWTDAWPTQTGVFWFYGRRTSASDDAFELLLVRVFRHRDQVSYVCEGAMLYKAEGARGLWQPAELPNVDGLRERLGGV